MTVLTLCLQKPQRAEEADLGTWVVDKWSVVISPVSSWVGEPGTATLFACIQFIDC